MERQGGVSQPRHDEIVNLADDIARRLSRIDDARVVKTDDKIIRINKGRKAGVFRGGVAYLREIGQAEADPTTYKEIVEAFPSTSTETSSKPGEHVVVGEVYILSVEDDFCTGVLFSGDYALPGDHVVFK